MENNNVDINKINAQIKKDSEFIDLLLIEINKVIVGQKYMLERLLIGLLGKGHILLEGVPGLAKTLAINTLSQVFSDPHVKAREMIVNMDHKKTGKSPLKLIANPIKMHETPPSYRMPPPLLGEHTDEILSEKIGLSEAEIKNLKDNEII